MSKRGGKPRTKVLRVLIPKGQRSKWIAVAIMGVVTAAAEAIAALSIAALIAAMTDATPASVELPFLGDIGKLLPGETSEEQLRYLAIWVGAFFVVKAGLQLTRTYVQSRVAQGTGAGISTRLFRGYLAMPYSFHISHNSSELMRNATWAADEVVTNFIAPIATILVQTSLLAMLLAVLITAAPVVTLTTLGILLPITIMIVQTVRPKLRQLGRMTKESVKHSLNSLQQTLHGIRDVKILGRERHFSSGFKEIRDELARARYLSVTLGFLPSVSIETLVIVAIIAFIAISSGTGLSDATLPTLGLFAYAGLRMMPAISKVVASVNKLRYGQSVASTVADDLEEVRNSGVRPPRVPAEPLDFSFTLQVNGVDFSYDESSPTLQNIDLTIKKGESLGIVGETGAGKSTLLDIILGLLTPTSGNVTVDGVDLTNSVRSWHANIGLVPQTIYLLDDTVRRNIAYGLNDDEIDDEAVRQAVRLAQLERFLETLPDGVETNVGERGIRLSGGQRQRVAIARALYRSPQVLVFDEGTASLDSLTEAELLRSIQDLREDHTIITVAHRLTTVKDSDRIILLEDGRIADQGTYTELQQRNPTFRLMTEQNAD